MQCSEAGVTSISFTCFPTLPEGEPDGINRAIRRVSVENGKRNGQCTYRQRPC